MSHVCTLTGHELLIPNVVRSHGIYLFDERGKRYMDLESGEWCTALGHNNKRLNKAIARQLESIMHTGFCYSSRVVEEAAEAVLEIAGLGPGGQCVFLSSGSEAVEVSRQIARHLTGKKLSMTLHDSYLGAYGTTTDRSRGWRVFDWTGCRSCGKPDCDKTCRKLASVPEDIADFTFEPGSASGFVRFPPEALIGNLAGIVRKNGGKIIANEVTTGMGRTGKWFGWQHYNLKPDMVAIGKGIGNGYPVSVTAMDAKTAKELGRRPYRYSQSHQNDPLGAAVALEVIRTLREDDLVVEAAQKGGDFFSRLESLVDGKKLTEIRGRGLMIAVDVAGKMGATTLFKGLLEKGFIVGNRKTAFRIDPPLIIREGEFGQFMEALEGVVARPQR
jgi:acetylornithine/N-succinyldiaminopimelate aminotransferase